MKTINKELDEYRILRSKELGRCFAYQKYTLIEVLCFIGSPLFNELLEEIKKDWEKQK